MKKKQVIGEAGVERAMLALSPARWIELFDEELFRRCRVTIQDAGAEKWAASDAEHSVLLPSESVTAFIEKYDLTEV